MLSEFLEFRDAREVPVGPGHTLRQPHDVITVLVTALAHHSVQHEVEILRRLRVCDEEEATLVGQGAEWHGLAHDLKLLLLVKGGTWWGTHTTYYIGNKHGNM